MNRRRFLAAVGAMGAVATGGVVGARLGNVRYYDPDSTASAELSPGERIWRASRLLHVLDHRSITRVTVINDGTDATPYERARYRHEWQPSRRRYRLAYTTSAVVPGNPPPTFPHVQSLIHHHEATRAYDDESVLPVTTVAYLSPGVILHDPSAETPMPPDDALRVRGAEDSVTRSVGFGRSSHDDLQLFDFVLTPDASWERVDGATNSDGDSDGDADGHDDNGTDIQHTDSTIVYEISGRDEYAKVAPLPLETVSVAPECRLRVTLDRETGRLLELDDRRVVEQPLSRDPEDPTSGPGPDGQYGTRQFTYRIRTSFDQYGTATAPMPGGDVPTPSPTDRVRELMAELTTY